MQDIHIYTDASANPQLGKGVGCFLILTPDLNDTSNLKYVEFEHGTSTTIELLTLCHIIDSLESFVSKPYGTIHIYTDCSNIVSLSKERTYNSNHKLAALYDKIQNFFHDNTVDVIYVKGHQPTRMKTLEHEKIFSLVDKGARKHLRMLVNSNI